MDEFHYLMLGIQYFRNTLSLETPAEGNVESTLHNLVYSACAIVQLLVSNSGSISFDSLNRLMVGTMNYH